jgi:hypothetical protein
MQLAFEPRAEAVEAIHAATALYTVGPIVEGLLDRVGWPERPGRLLDPCTGDGSFLVRALSRIETPPHDFASVRRVHGWEIHPVAAEHAKRAVVHLLRTRGWPFCEAFAAAIEIISVGDFLTDSRIQHGEFSVIAGNPPYLRYGHLPDIFKEIYDLVIAEHARGDLLHSFLNTCVELLPDDGAIAFVSADRWLFNSTAAKLRESIGLRVGLSYIARLDPTTSFYRPKYRRRGSPPRIHPVEVILTPGARLISPITATSISPDDGTVTATAGPTLADVASVRIAPWLGPNGIFVIDDSTAAKMPRDQLIPAVDTDDIDPASDKLATPTRMAIVTSRAVEPTGAVKRHLLKQKHLLPKKCEGKPYWMPPETITLDTSRPSLLIPRIARRLRVVHLPAGILPVNHNLQVIDTKGGLSLAEIEAILTSAESHAWITRHAPRLENGFLSITTTLLRRLPIPHNFTTATNE